MKILSSPHNKRIATVLVAALILVGGAAVYAFSQRNDAPTQNKVTPSPAKNPSAFSMKDEGGKVLLNGADIANAEARTGTSSLGTSKTAELLITTTSSGAAKLKQATQDNVGKRLSVHVEDQRISEPLVTSPITDGAIVVTGSFSLQQAEEFVARINQ